MGNRFFTMKLIRIPALWKIVIVDTVNVLSRSGAATLFAKLSFWPINLIIRNCLEEAPLNHGNKAHYEQPKDVDKRCNLTLAASDRYQFRPSESSRCKDQNKPNILHLKLQ